MHVELTDVLRHQSLLMDRRQQTPQPQPQPQPRVHPTHVMLGLRRTWYAVLNQDTST